MSGVCESEGGWKVRERRRERKGGGVNIHHEDPDGIRVCMRVFQRWSDLPAVVQKMRGQHGDEDVLPVHRKEQSSRTMDTCS